MGDGEEGNTPHREGGGQQEAPASRESSTQEELGKDIVLHILAHLDCTELCRLESAARRFGGLPTRVATEASAMERLPESLRKDTVKDAWEPTTDACGRVLLWCPFRDRKECMRLGGVWDPAIRMWCVEPGGCAQDFKKWWPKPSKEEENAWHQPRYNSWEVSRGAGPGMCIRRLFVEDQSFKQRFVRWQSERKTRAYILDLLLRQHASRGPDIREKDREAVAALLADSPDILGTHMRDDVCLSLPQWRPEYIRATQQGNSTFFLFSAASFDKELLTFLRSDVGVDLSLQGRLPAPFCVKRIADPFDGGPFPIWMGLNGAQWGNALQAAQMSWLYTTICYRGVPDRQPGEPAYSDWMSGRQPCDPPGTVSSTKSIWSPTLDELRERYEETCRFLREEVGLEGYTEEMMAVLSDSVWETERDNTVVASDTDSFGSGEDDWEIMDCSDEECSSVGISDSQPQRGLFGGGGSEDEDLEGEDAETLAFAAQMAQWAAVRENREFGARVWEP